LKKPKKFAFLQDWGTYGNETLVIVGMDAEEIIKHIQRKGFNFTAGFPASLRRVFKATSVSARCVFEEGRSILWLPSWKDDWENWETLMHEIVHLIHRCLCINKHMDEEDEAQAYQMEYLFRAIRIELHRRTYVRTRLRTKQTTTRSSAQSRKRRHRGVRRTDTK